MYIDLETEIYLQKLEGDIRSQLYWGVVPEIPIEWQPNQIRILPQRPNIFACIFNETASFRKRFCLR